MVTCYVNEFLSPLGQNIINTEHEVHSPHLRMQREVVGYTPNT